MTRVAAIDCGTNSIRLLIADVDEAAGTLVELERRMEIVRLGQDVDRTGVFAAAALERTFAACQDFAGLIADHGCDRVRFVATSASRDVANRAAFVSGVREVLRVDPEVVSGAEEAALSFTGATRELEARAGWIPGSGEQRALPGSGELHSPPESGEQRPLPRSGKLQSPPESGELYPPPYLVIDIGGGSTEFVLGGGAGGGRPKAASVALGCVRMTERHLQDDPPTAAQVRAAQLQIDAAIADASAGVPLREAATLVGLAGSVTTVAAMALGLPAYQPERIHHARVTADDVHDVARRLLSMPRAARAALPFMHPGRVDVIGAGALILSRIVTAAGADEVLVSEHDILDGIAFSIA